MRDPHMRQNLKAKLVYLLYAKPDKNLNERLLPIARRHAVLTNGLEAFRYKGKLYWGNTHIRGVRPTLLHNELKPIMDEWLSEHRILEEEQGKCKSYLSAILISADTQKDIRTLLPESLHPHVDFNSWPVAVYGQPDEANWDSFLEQTKEAMSLIKQRMVINLIT
jgi:hypothetical protein